MVREKLERLKESRREGERKREGGEGLERQRQHKESVAWERAERWCSSERGAVGKGDSKVRDDVEELDFFSTSQVE